MINFMNTFVVMSRFNIRLYILPLFVITLFPTMTSCVSIPDGIKPVQPFDVNRYLGKWYEIARLDHRFERGMQQISAEYTLRDDGGLNVVNRGFIVDDGVWKTADGKAYFVSSNDQGYLKVSFFGPFYGAYIVFELDEHYQYAFITSSTRDYLWLLSRTPTIDDQLMEHFLSTVKTLGFDTSQVIKVMH